MLEVSVSGEFSKQGWKYSKSIASEEVGVISKFVNKYSRGGYFEVKDSENFISFLPRNAKVLELPSMILKLKLEDDKVLFSNYLNWEKYFSFHEDFLYAFRQLNNSLVARFKPYGVKNFLAVSQFGEEEKKFFDNKTSSV